MNVGYKKCRDDKIVKLEILGENNEERSDVVNKRYAKFRCSEARVLGIYKLSKCRRKFKKCKCAESTYDATFKYIRGDIVQPKASGPFYELGDRTPSYEKNINKVCAQGIHYFLTKKAAIGYFKGILIIKRGKTKLEYGDNGGIACEEVYDNEDHRGSYTYYSYYHKSGKIARKQTYDKCGYKCGLYEEYYENGQLKEKCTYDKCEYKCGLHEEYYSDGQLKKKCTYKNGRLCGSYEEYYKSGQLKEKCTYADGRLMSRRTYSKGGEIEEFSKN